MITRFPALMGTVSRKLLGASVLGATLCSLAACQPAPATASEQAGATPSGAALPQSVAPQAPVPGTAQSATPGTMPPGQQAPAQSKKRIGMANPASLHCLNAGGKLEIRTGSSGGQYGVCHMPDGNSCEEWSFFRTGQCTAESLKNR